MEAIQLAIVMHIIDKYGMPGTMGLNNNLWFLPEKYHVIFTRCWEANARLLD